MSSFLTEVLLTLCIQPYPMIPLESYFAAGFTWWYFGIETHCQLVFLSVVMLLQLVAILMSFGYRHQAVVQICNRKKYLLSGATKKALCMFAHLHPFTLGLIFYIADVPRKDYRRFLMEVLGYDSLILGVLSIENIAIYSGWMNGYLYLHKVYFFTAALVFFVVVAGFASHTFHLLGAVRQKMSSRNYAFQKSSFLTLCVQIIVPLLIMSAPTICATYILITRDFQLHCLIKYTVYGISTHSILSIACVVLVTPTHKTFIRWQMRRLVGFITNNPPQKVNAQVNVVAVVP